MAKGQGLKQAQGSSALSRICELAHELTGVQLSERHHDMMRSRIRKRATELGLEPSAEAYLSHVLSHREAETPHLISLVTTHHTYFFREFTHFEFLTDSALPALSQAIRARSDRTLRVWSAACSRGQEAYSLAMLLERDLPRVAPGVSYEILGTDVDPESVRFAENGVYPLKEIQEAPLGLLANHWARGTGDIAQFVKAKKSIRQKCRFETANLLKLPPLGGPKFDVIFCRNVFIYFSQEQIELITKSLLDRLTPEGYLVIGVSESISQLGLDLKSEGPSVYRLKNAKSQSTAQLTSSGTKKVPMPVPVAARVEQTAKPTGPLRVVCVDDSPVVLTLLKKILSKDHGFEVVGTAPNGKEAHEVISRLKPDAITLDIHMPEMDGVSYLKKHFNSSHPPVIMVTSVSREDGSLAAASLGSGASDFVEKPALNNIQEKGEELRNKIKTAVKSKNASSVSLKLDQSFQKKIKVQHPERHLRVIIGTLAAKDSIARILKDSQEPSPPTLVLIEGMDDQLAVASQTLSAVCLKPILPFSGSLPKTARSITLGSVSKHFSGLAGATQTVSIMVLGEPSTKASQLLSELHGAQLIVEDLGSQTGQSGLKEIASWVIPVTSFAYHSDQFFAEAEEKAKAA